MNKSPLRDQLLFSRAKMKKQQVQDRSTKIIDQIKQNNILESFNTIAMYMPFKNEVDVIPLMKDLLAQGKTICVPKIENKRMNFYKVANFEEFKVSSFGILEPTSSKLIPKMEIDAMIIPAIGFTQTKYRLGYGGGYYDRYLADYPNKKIGVIFDDFLIGCLNIESHDIPVDMIITDKEIL